MKLKVLITGANGILGSTIIKKFENIPDIRIFALDKKFSSYLNFKSRTKKIKCDFTDKYRIKKIIYRNKINFIIHLGAVTQVLEAYEKPFETFLNNIIGTINFLEIIKNSKRKIYFIFSSSDKAYGKMTKSKYFENDPLKGDYPYDVSKSSSDLIVQSYSKTYNINVGVVRSGNIYGPRDFNLDRIVPHVITRLIQNKPPIIRSNGKLRRDYIYVEDIADAYKKLMNKMIKSNKKLFIYNIGSNTNLSVLSLTNKITKLMNVNIKPKILNKSKIEIPSQKLNYSKIKKELKWRPKTKINEGLKNTIEWYRKNCDQI